MKNYVITALCLLLFTSCMTQKKIESISNQYLRDHPEVLAELCSSKYPVQWKFIPGQTVFLETPPVFIPGDTVECPDGSKVVTPSREVKCPDHESRVDTLIVPDLALADHWRFNTVKWQMKASGFEGELKSEKKLKTQLAVILGIVSLLLVALLIKRK